jgi:Zn-dependent protease
LRTPRLVLFRRPVPVCIGRGGLVPVGALGLLFAGFAGRVGLPIGAAAMVGAFGGTASLIVHELGHVHGTRRLTGLRPVSITLISLGAATRLEGAYRSGRDQARVAIAGPAASFGLAIVLSPALVAPISQTARGLLLMLIFLNVAIGAISLIPANPLDGHKLIVGVLWSVVGTESSARTLIRRFASAWLAVESVGAVFLLATRPMLGIAAILMAASLYGQKVYARLHHA